MTTPQPQRTNPVFVVGAVLALVALLAFTLLNGTAERGDPAYLAGEMLGATAVAGLLWLIVFGIALALGKGRTANGKWQIAFWTTGALALSQLIVMINRGQELIRHHARVAISDSERAGLIIDPDVIHHRQFGFSLPNPGPDFLPDSATQHMMDSVTASHTDLHAWVLRSTVQGEVLVIQVSKDTAVSEESFRGFVKGVRESSAGHAGVEVLSDSATWAGGGEYQFTAKTSNGAFLQIRCIPHTGGGVGLIVCVTTGSADPHGLDSVRAGLSFGGS